MNNSNTFRYIELDKGICLKINETRDSFVYILNGQVTASFAKNKWQNIKVGDTLLITKNTFIQFETIDKTVLILLKLENIIRHFSKNLIKQMIEISNGDQWNILEAKGHLHKFWTLIFLYLKDSIDMKNIDQSIEDQLFMLIKEYYSTEEISAFLHPILDENTLFAQLVKENCLRVNSISELAQLTNYSPSGFIKKFQKCFNEAPYQWITKFKAKRIMQDICFTQDYFCEISDRYGFTSQSYFYTFCKKHYGLTPTELRKQEKVRIKYSNR
ncbi:AraC family transcriptional regulator [Dysgonomonas sp. Marseille-P4677]|uniref:helix-turn-helix domain-containing protein n=1 Tax=Dysgonomonas sp. Marseille-P4677 TaxID=2364790 RepID=UPI0019140E46|nr:helix-turn-helix transcriptional regulator [Dysgonomonas sp. Marseille-P4677]